MSKNKQELSEETLENLDKTNREIIEEMVRMGWDRKKHRNRLRHFLSYPWKQGT
jgi:cation transport regulator ChaB